MHGTVNVKLKVGLYFPQYGCGIKKFQNIIIFLEINLCNSGEIYQIFSRPYVTDIRIYYNKIHILLSAGTLTILIS